MRKYIQMTWLISILMMILLLTGCDLGLVGEIIVPGGNSTDLLTGTIVDADEFTWDGSVLTVPELSAGEKLIIAISPFDSATVSVSQYRANVTVDQTRASAKTAQLVAGSRRLLGIQKDSLPFPAADQSENVMPVEEYGDYIPYNGGDVVETKPDVASVQRGSDRVREQSSAQPMSAELLSTRSFYVRTDANVNKYKSVTATLVKSTSTLEIYVSTDAAVASSILDKIANEFAWKVYPSVTDFMGAPYDKDRNKKTTLLITPLIYNGSSTKMVGYFDEVNLFDKTGTNYSNETDMIYMNSTVVTKGNMTQIYANLAHEFAHLIFGGKKYQANPNGIHFTSLTYSDRWFNEGCAMLATHVAGYVSLGNDWRIYDRNYGYFGYPNKDSLLVWEGSREESNYGSAGLFVYYLFEQHRSAFAPVLSKDGKVEFALEEYTGHEFSELLRDWMMTNLGDRLNGFPEYHYPYLALKSSPAVKTVTSTADFTIHGMGVQYFAVEGPATDLAISLSFTSGKQTVLNAGYMIVRTN